MPVMQVLMDDGQHEDPSKDNIMNGIRWLVDGAQARPIPRKNI